MTTKVFEAKSPGTCPACNLRIDIGQRIAKDNKTGKYTHADCIWKNHTNPARETKPINKAGAINPQTPPTPQPLSDQEIGEITAVSINYIKNREEFKLVDISELIPLIAEQMALRRLKKDQEFSSQMSKLVQYNKLGNIERVKGG